MDHLRRIAKPHRRIAAIACGLLLVGVWAPWPCLADPGDLQGQGPAYAGPVWYVATDGDDLNPGTASQPFATIQRGIAASSPGHTVILAAGTYTGSGNYNVDIGGTSLTLRSQTGDPADVILDGQGQHRGFIFQTEGAATIIVRGITIANGHAEGAGGAVLIGNPDAESAVIAPVFQRCVFRNCSASQRGGAVAVGFLSAPPTRAPVFVDCRFAFNQAPLGGAVHVDWGNSPRFKNCRFYRNTADQGGALFFFWESRSDLTGCVLRENEAADAGGAAVIQWENYTRWMDCDFVANHAGNSGGAVFNPLGNSVAMSRFRDQDQFQICDFDSNAADLGAGIYLAYGCGLDFSGCRFRWNDATTAGGACRLLSDYSHFENCLFVGNTAAAGAVLSFTGDGNPEPPPATAFVNTTMVANMSGSGIVHCDEVGAYQLSVDRVLAAANLGGPLLVYPISTALPAVTCTDIHGNEGGDWTGPLSDLLGTCGNFSADPLFCSSATGDYTLSDISPCLPGQHPDGADCGLIGAFGAGCASPTAGLSIDEAPVASARLALWQNVPNPFNPQTRLAFDLPVAAPVSLRVFDLRGHDVRTLLDGEILGPGRHELIWDGENDRGLAAAAGVYVCRVQAGGLSALRRMTMVR